ncbi:MAG: HEPN domain-containing protein [Bacteroidetes bacterium]|nr:HEPN domain-containing protein [Bacteroidota bacterium]
MKPYEEWLLKAYNDLKSAKKLMSGDDKILDTAIYHTQQCAEKAFKSFLSFRQQLIQKTHDAAFLAELCINLNKDFEAILEDAKSFAGYDIAFRYPDEILEPDEEDVENAIEKAEKIFNFVKAQIQRESQ